MPECLQREPGSGRVQGLRRGQLNKGKTEIAAPATTRLVSYGQCGSNAERGTGEPRAVPSPRVSRRALARWWKNWWSERWQEL